MLPAPSGFVLLVAGALGGSCEQCSDIVGMVDLGRYPIHLSDAESTTWIAPLRQQWLEHGRLSLPGFIVEPGKMVDQVTNLPSYRRLQVVSSYGVASPDDEPAVADVDDHPTRRLWAQDVHAIAGDQIGAQTLLRRFYESPCVTRFVASILGVQSLYRYDDPFQDVNVMITKDGGQRAYHYDASDFVVTLMLQPSTAGGEFEFAPNIRGINDEKYDAVSSLFRGEWPTVVSKAQAGTLTLFNGRRSMHRVRASYGPQARIIAVLSYDTRPASNQTRPSVEKNRKLYGDRVILASTA